MKIPSVDYFCSLPVLALLALMILMPAPAPANDCANPVLPCLCPSPCGVTDAASISRYASEYQTDSANTQSYEQIYDTTTQMLQAVEGEGTLSKSMTDLRTIATRAATAAGQIAAATPPAPTFIPDPTATANNTATQNAALIVAARGARRNLALAAQAYALSVLATAKQEAGDVTTLATDIQSQTLSADTHVEAQLHNTIEAEYTELETLFALRAALKGGLSLDRLSRYPSDR